MRHFALALTDEEREEFDRRIELIGAWYLAQGVNVKHPRGRKDGVSASAVVRRVIEDKLAEIEQGEVGE